MEKEYISFYLSIDLVKQLKGMSDNEKIQLDLIKNYYESEKSWVKQNMDELEDNILKYRALLLKSREAYQEASDEHLKKLESFWEDIAKELPNFKTKIKKISDELLPLIQEVEKLKKEINGVSSYQIKELLEIVDRVDSMSPEKAKMFSYLIENFKNK